MSRITLQLLSVTLLCLIFIDGSESSQATPTNRTTCYGRPLVTKKVFESSEIFAGKIVNLTEIVVQQRQTSTVRPINFQSHNYFYTYSMDQRKRRRDSPPRDVNVTLAIAVVKVKTVFKGDEDREGRYLEVTINEKSESKALAKCLRKLRIGDTRVFFYRNEEFTNQSCVPLPPALSVLATVRKAVKVQPGKFSSLVNDEPCEQANCAFGELCVVDGGRPVCKCPQSCSNAYSPVCGTDGITYSSECLLRQFACQHRHSVRLKHSGECDKPDPCVDKACLFGSRCLASADGHYASCECPDSCPNFGDSDDSQPVCGSDGHFYKSKCEMDRHACHMGKNITVKHYGKCDPCEDIGCAFPQVCHLDEDRRPHCRCGESCPMEFNPVCGSDGKTYSNECVMRQESCRIRRDIRIIYRGKCSSGVNPCESRTCHGYESCAINRFGIAQCVCALVCDPIFSPVCGSDRRTYDSECELMLSACRESRNVTVTFKGPCDEGSLCSQHKCPPGAICSERGGRAFCECPVCGSEYEPVCGTDTVSYQNPCRLHHEACTNGVEITIRYPGLCNGCDEKQCDFYSVCEADLDGARCVCAQNCTTTQSRPGQSVCGTDGKLYESECELKRSACQQQKFIVVADRGFCDLCENVQCKFGARCEKGNCICPTHCPSQREPVCGSDSKTYTNECELQKSACRKNNGVPPLTVHFYGECQEGLTPQRPWVPDRNEEESSSSVGVGVPPSSVILGATRLCESIRCEFGSICEVGADSLPRCSCQFNCSATPKSTPICASDLKLYYSDCEMRREACHRQIELRRRPMELCEEMELKPCYGEDPLHTSGGEEVSCGMNRNACPSGAFCHRGKCCKKPEEKTTTTTTSKPTNVKVGSSYSCDDSVFGCCEDGKTSALGENFGGCPSNCHCNRLGSIRETCDPDTKQCDCRVGVGGERCDRCLPGFWGLARVMVDGEKGCRACGCSRFGSVREDCEQMTGRCVCKPGVLGPKCESCREGEFLSPYGCTTDPTNLGRTCDEVVCTYGAECETDGDRAGCMCNIVCSEGVEGEEVCSSDGFTYESECQVRLQSCRDQKPIWVVHRGPCPHGEGGTESPVRRWTGGVSYFTEPDGGIGRDGYGRITMRHLPQDATPPDSFHKNFYSHRPPTAASVQFRSYLGDSCATTSDCFTPHSICLSGWCICREGFYEDPERIICKPIHSHVSGVLSCGKSASQCQTTASCFDHRNGSYTCVCPLGKGGPEEDCQQKDAPTPLLGPRSTIRLGKIGGSHKLSVELKVVPFLDFSHGLLLFSAQHENGSGDFFSLALIDGYVELRYDLGDGPAIIRSSNRLASGGIYHITAKRYNRDGLLRVEGQEDVKGTSPGQMKSLNLDHGGYLGYTPLNSTKIWEVVGTSEGFVGCILNLRVGRRPVPFSDRDPLISSFQKISQCPLIPHSQRLTTTPIHLPEEEDEDNSVATMANLEENEIDSENIDACQKSSCGSNGICWNDRSKSTGYRCICHPDYDGTHCDKKSGQIPDTGMGAMLDFRGSTFLSVPRIEGGGRSLDLEVWFLPRAPSGLILYDGQDWGKGDFIALTLLNGHVQFLFDLGSGIANVTSQETLSIGEWHWVVASRKGREGRLQVNGGKVHTGRSPPGLSELNLELPLHIGGVSDLNLLPRDLRTMSMSSFDGVVQYLRINGETYSREISTALKARLAHAYEGPPCGSSISACSNGGTCIPRLHTHVCLCPPQYSGNNCETRKDLPGPVRFDGENYIKFPRKVVKTESFNVSEYDDFYNDNFDAEMDELFRQWSEDGSESDALEDLGGPEDLDFVEDGDEDVTYETDEKKDNGERERVKAHRRNRIELVFRTNEEVGSGVILWTGRKGDDSEGRRRGYLGLFIVNGHPELRMDLGAKNKRSVFLRSKVSVSDGRWHQVLIARRRRLVVLQVDGAIPQRATASPGSNVLLSDGSWWIGGVAGSVLPGDIPPELHQGFVGCVDLVRVEKRRLPLAKIAKQDGIPFCDDDD